MDLLDDNRLRTVKMKVPEIEVWADKYWEDLSDERMVYQDKSERDWLFVVHARDFSKDFILKHCTTPRLQEIVKNYGQWNKCYADLMKAWGFNKW